MSKPTIEPNTQTNILDACPVIDGGTVSKPFIDLPGLKQIVFAMDQGQSISEHRVPFDATVHVLDGELSFRIEGETFALKANDWIRMAPNAGHDLEAKSPTRFLLTMIKQSGA